MRRGSTSARDALQWKWSHGGTSFGDFGNPIGGTRYALCVYDRSGPAGAPATLVSPAAPVGTVTCGAKNCWQPTTKGFKYKDRAGGSDGLTYIKLHSGATPAAKIAVKARGTRLGVPASPYTPKVTVQLRKSDDDGVDCWGAEYQGIQIRRNDDGGFKAASY
jgi:hypothetical protein